MITPEQVAILRTHDLKTVEVQQAFAGFLHQELHHRHGVDIPVGQLLAAIELYAEATEKVLDKAVAQMNQQTEIQNTG